MPGMLEDLQGGQGDWSHLSEQGSNRRKVRSYEALQVFIRARKIQAICGLTLRMPMMLLCLRI